MMRGLDMAKYMKMQLNLGVSAEGVRVVPEDVLEAIRKPNNAFSVPLSRSIYTKPQAPVTMVVDKYGLGFFTGYYRGRHYAHFVLLLIHAIATSVMNTTV